MQNPHKWHFYLHYSCSIQNISLPLHPQFHAGDVCTSSAEVADIFKRRLLALCSDYQKCRKFQYIQDLATIDVLRDINYPSCAYLVRLLRIYICAHAYLNYVAREYSFIFGVGFALSVLMYKAMRQPLIVELTKGKFHAFLLFLIGLGNSPVSKNIYV